MSDTLFGGPAEPPEFDDRVTSDLRVLITVKAAPNPSATYGETVCVAGLRLDLEHMSWVRLYPINFRFIESDNTFKKYDVVTLTASPSTEPRRESWKPRIDTLKVVGHLEGWKPRMPVLRPLTRDQTMCDLNARALDGGPSLGLVPARRVTGLKITPHPGWSRDEQQKIDDYVSQPELFDSGKPKTALQAPRFKAHYQWTCFAAGCKGHEQGLIDWEFTAFQRRLPADEASAKDAIRQKWLESICSPANEVFFYVGNQAKRHQVFSVLGVVYPKL